MPSILFRLTLLLAAVIGASAFGAEPNAVVEISYDAVVPTLKEVVGHTWGEDLTAHHEMERYLEALAASSPRLRLVEYGRSWENRKLYYVVIASEAQQRQLDEIRAGLQRLADPRETTRAEFERLVAALPVVVWLSHGVHGNESSTTETALLTAYHLLAARHDRLVDVTLDRAIVILDPLQNPDGRERFVQYWRQTRGRTPDADPQAAEHREPWPGGRGNHYLFDLNRDWFALTQPETRGKVAALRRWRPQVTVDLHEMGRNQTYFFPPAAKPLNPHLPSDYVSWTARFGKNAAAWLDRNRVDYFTREGFDAFYPGYADTWSSLRGAIGLTLEQASVRVITRRRDDGTVAHLRDAVRNHFLTSLATIETAVNHREELLRRFGATRRAAAEQASTDETQEFIIGPGGDARRTEKLIALLLDQGIEVRRAVAPFVNPRVRDAADGAQQARTFPAGTFVVPVAQPEGRLASTLLTRHVPLEEEFVREQVRRKNKRLDDQFYDVTAWSLPLLYGVECYVAEATSQGEYERLEDLVSQPGAVHGPPAKLAYLIPWGTNAAAKALAFLHRRNVRVYAADREFVLAGRRFPPGSLIVKTRDNSQRLHDIVVAAAKQSGADVYPTDSGWVEQGIGLGSDEVNFLPKPRVAVAYHHPTRPPSAGWVRHLLDQEYRYPTTILNTSDLRGADLTEYDVLILPDAADDGDDYGDVLGDEGVKRLKDWVSSGGVLITFAEASRWAARDDVDLIAARCKKKQTGTTQKQRKVEADELAETPGAILRVKLDVEHWLAFGCRRVVHVPVDGNRIFCPLQRDQGDNVGLYVSQDRLLASGFMWDETRKQTAHQAYLMHQPRGRGHVVAFAEDPNFRGLCDGLHLVLLNAVFFGSAH